MFGLVGWSVAIPTSVESMVHYHRTVGMGLQTFLQRLVSKSHFQPHLVNLLPLDPEWLAALGKKPWPSKVLPAYTMPPGPLFSGLLRQLFFVLLYQDLAESLASENASRLTAMQLAEENITNRLVDLRLNFNQMRQTAITEELLDIVAGYEALTRNDRLFSSKGHL